MSLYGHESGLEGWQRKKNYSGAKAYIQTSSVFHFGPPLPPRMFRGTFNHWLGELRVHASGRRGSMGEIPPRVDPRIAWTRFWTQGPLGGVPPQGRSANCVNSLLDAECRHACPECIGVLHANGANSQLGAQVEKEGLRCTSVGGASRC